MCCLFLSFCYIEYVRVVSIQLVQVKVFIFVFIMDVNYYKLFMFRIQDSYLLGEFVICFLVKRYNERNDFYRNIIREIKG